MWSRRTGNSPPPTNNRKDTSTNRRNLTEHLLNTSRRHRTAERTRKISKSSGRLKGKKKRMEGRDVRPWEGAKKRRGSRILGSPLRSAGTERGLQRLGGEHNPHPWQAEDPCTDWSAATPRAPA